MADEVWGESAERIAAQLRLCGDVKCATWCDECRAKVVTALVGYAGSECAATKARLADAVETMRSAENHIENGIQETQADYYSPPEPATEYDMRSVTVVVDLRRAIAMSEATLAGGRGEGADGKST